MYCLASNNRNDYIFKTGHAPCDDAIIAGNHMLLTAPKHVKLTLCKAVLTYSK